MSASNLHIAWGRLFLGALASAGVEHLVLSPGSRSTPLALAAAAEPRLTVHVLVDERSAAFFALGQARWTGKPSALVCTSGTAGAHFFPAVIEASASHTPLVVVTADRPWEAYDCRAPQTIDQVKMFGAHVRFAAELGLPDPSREALRAVPRIAAQAVLHATYPTPGAVHVNARFRKPLEPVDVAGIEAWEAEVEALLRRGVPRVLVPRASPSEAAIEALASACAASSRGLIVCGPAPAHGVGARDAVLELSRVTGYPVLAEATSQVRFGARERVCSSFDLLLRSPAFRRAHAPDVVIEIVGAPTSSAYATYLGEHPAVTRFVLAPHGWSDPSGGASAMIFGDAYAMAVEVAQRLGGRDAADGAFRASFMRADARAWAVVRREADGLGEGEVARRVVASLPEGGALVVGNSMPIRDVDTYAEPGSRRLRVLCQRGANGIDGLVSGAAGARSVSDGPMALLLGDVSMLHDLGGLAALARVTRPLAVVVVQNDGGRIFDELPIARRPELAGAVDACFTTPHGVRFGDAARGFGLRYDEVRDGPALDAALARALLADGATVIEAVVHPGAATAARARLRSEVAAAIADDGEGRA